MKRYLIAGVIVCMGAWMFQSAAIANESADETMIEEMMPEDTGEASDNNTLSEEEMNSEQDSEAPVEEENIND